MAHADDDRPNEAPPGEQPDAAPTSGDPAAPADPSSPAVPGAEAASDRPRRRRRRRRRKGPRPEGAVTAVPAEAGAGGEASSVAGAPVPARPCRAKPRRARTRRAGRHAFVAAAVAVRARAAPPGERPSAGAPREARPREERPPAGAPREARPPVREPRGKDGRERGPRGPKNQPYGKSRNAFERKPEVQAHRVFESVVDRGFEDVADEANDGAVRRITWTIVKRTVADQRSNKLISAVYVLQRDGADTEFANLGTARAAVNKTIAHPEKLTRSKSEYAAAKKK